MNSELGSKPTIQAKTTNINIQLLKGLKNHGPPPPNSFKSDPSIGNNSDKK